MWFSGIFLFLYQKRCKNICIRIKKGLFLHPLSGIGSYLDSGMFEDDIREGFKYEVIDRD